MGNSNTTNARRVHYRRITCIVWCNNAGVITRGNITEITDDEYDLTMKVNVEAPFRLCRASIPLMKKGSVIVNISSCWGLRPGPNHPLYVMSKAAIGSLTQCLGIDHAHQGIRVNAVCPGLIDTEMVRDTISRETVKNFEKSFPISRLGSPGEVASLVGFLLSDNASYITGAAIDINGGDFLA